MTNPLKSQPANDLALFLLRLPLGLAFLLYGYSAVFRHGVKNFVDGHSGDVPDFMPHPIGLTVLYAIPWINLLAGTLLVLGLYARSAATATLLVLIAVMVAMPQFLNGGTYYTLAPVVAYVGIAFAVIVLGAGPMSLNKLVLGSD